MIKINRSEQGELKIVALLEFDHQKDGWVDGLYFLSSNSSIAIYLNDEAEKQLIDFLCKDKEKDIYK